MKKSIILKSFLVILVCAMLIFAVTPVYAATDEGFEDIFNTTNTNTGNTNASNTNSSNTNASNVQNLNALRNTSNTANTSNTLPKTGLEDSLPTVLLVVVFAISSVYAYKKIKDYRNID